jgi:hypothetical protein
MCRRAEGRLPIATTSKKLSFFSMVNWRPRFEERNGLCELGKRSTFRQTLLINFITPHRSQRGCFASARRQAKRSLQKVGNTGCDAYTSPPKVDATQEAGFIKKVIELAPKYRTELLKEAK